jgi:hypothetical protein
MMEPFAYIARHLRRRSTARLQAAYRAVLAAECECDTAYGFTCGVHRREEELRWALEARSTLTTEGKSHG